MDISETVPPPASPPASAPKRALIANLFGERSEQGLDLHGVMNVLRRQRTVICACIALITVVAVAVVFQMTPRYTAEASVILDMRKTQVVDMQAVLSGLPPDMAALHGEMEVLKSPAIAERVVKKLNLTTIPEFNGRLRSPTVFAPVSDAIQWTKAQIAPLFGAKQEAPIISDDPIDAELKSTTRALLSHIDIFNDGRSYVLKIRAEAENPQLAASIANAYADAYLVAQLEAKFEAVRRANNWLNDRLAEMRGEVQASDRAVEMYKAQHNLTLSNTGETVTGQQVGELNSQLILAAADRAQKESNLFQIQGQLKSGGVAAATQVLSSPIIISLRQQETDLIRQEAQLATRYKPEHPAMINIKAQERDLEQKIQGEIQKVVQGMAGEVAAARAKESSLRASLQDLQKSSAVQGQTEVELHELERQSDSNRTLYENFLNRFKQTTEQENIQQPDARLVSPAAVPSAPSYPRTGLLLSLAFLGSIMVGIVAAFGVERLDNGFRTGDQIEKLARVTPLGLVPALKTTAEQPYDVVLSRPISPYSEAIRTVRTALRYSDIDNPPKVVLVTSALPDEGKSVFSLSLARSVAHSGAKALLIDCDLRRPSLSKLLKLEPRAGLLSLFEPNASLQNALQVDPKSGMHFIGSASGITTPQDVLGSKQLRLLIDKLRPHYDLIVLDTPPVLAVSDALILSHVADTTMFLVRWGKTPRPVVLGALKSFQTNGGDLAGVVLTRVDFRKHATYGYGDAGYYYGSYGKRYAGYYRQYDQS
ncbi:MAG TPA: polysaccharide biosynthesis tyrosine autokinase [Stellaceae bacterium]|nr:polysaccharide biosynthesis tyrosine autokinase [Stellaceae bacterium]